MRQLRLEVLLLGAQRVESLLHGFLYALHLPVAVFADAQVALQLMVRIAFLVQGREDLMQA